MVFIVFRTISSNLKFFVYMNVYIMELMYS